MMEYDQRLNQRWNALQHHRKAASRHPLQILIWGPGNDGSVEFSARCQLRDRLLEQGHMAEFSEDLCEDPEALDDPIDDERLQAEAADLIVMIYGSRGTQTERDLILSERHLAAKSIVFVEHATQQVVLDRSLVSTNWKVMSEAARIITYSSDDLPALIIDTTVAITEKARRASYVRSLRGGLLR